MSFDISLLDPVSKDVCEVPAHLLTGGNYLADYDSDSGKFSAKPNTEAWINITYNYSRYFREAIKSIVNSEDGIRYFNKKKTIDCIPIVSKMIKYIEDKYRDSSGDWIKGERFKTEYINKVTNERMDFNKYLYFITHDIGNAEVDDVIEPIEIKYTISEGDTSDYWETTAANALSALHKLLALMQLRPDSIVEVE